MRHSAVAAVLGVLLLTGCYGSTEPATDVQQESARLNAQGTANNGPAVAQFEYHPTNGAGFLRTTDPRNFPSGASGPFSETAQDLLPATPYAFRACGRDASAADYVCANTRSFTTVKPPGDGVQATFWFPGRRAAQVTVDARSGPAGEQPSGRIATETYQGFVSCVAVAGDRAAVVSVGQNATENDPGPEFLWYTFAGPAKGLLDGGAGDGVGPDCKTLSLAGEPRLPQPGEHEIAIWDSP